MTNIEIHFLDDIVPGPVSPGPGDGVGRVVALRGADGGPPVAPRRRVVHQGVGVAGVTPPQPRPRRHVAVPGGASNKGLRNHGGEGPYVGPIRDLLRDCKTPIFAKVRLKL